MIPRNSLKNFINSEPGKRLLLLAIPLVILVANYQVRILSGPYHGLYLSDPSYPYLLNALNIYNGIPPGHTDHPGTTVQMMGGWILKFQSLVATDPNTSILRDPETQITSISQVFVFCLGLAVTYLGFVVYSVTGRIVPAMISQALPLSFAPVWIHLPRLAPEPLLVTASVLLAAAVIPILAGANRETSHWRALLMGAIIGAGIVTKLTFLPMILFLLVFKTAKNRIFAVLGLAGASAFFLYPIWPYLSRVAKWAFLLLLNSGRYGGGEPGLPDIQSMWSSFTSIALETPLLLLFLPLLAWSYLKARRKGAINPDLGLLSGICFIVLFLSIIVTLKHFAHHYLMPVYALSGLFFLLLAQSVAQPFQQRMMLLTVFLVTVMTLHAAGNAFATLKEYRLANKTMLALEHDALESGCQVVRYYRSGSVEYALYFGNDFAHQAYSYELGKIYSNPIHYNPWHHSFSHFSTPLTEIEMAALKSRNDICLLGTLPLEPERNPDLILLKQSGEAQWYQLTSPD